MTTQSQSIEAYIGDPQKHAFLIGIGGVSMCSLAETLFAAGCVLSGSDHKETPVTRRLQNEGIPVYIGHEAAHVDGVDYIIRSAAIHEDNPEIMEARKRGIPVFERAQAWGAVMQGYRQAVCVAGTHGKTTTTSMLTHIALQAQTDPTVMIGGSLPILGGGHRVGQKRDVILLESCEYCNSFLYFNPTVAVILNVEEDHLDFFKDLADIQKSFRAFALRTPEEGTVVANADDPGTMEAIRDLPRRVVTFGLEQPADYTAREITFKKGTTRFDVYKDGRFYMKQQLLVPGRHNVLNALAAIAAADAIGIDPVICSDGLAAYGGVGRRFEFKGEYGGAMIYDDYAHHPHEIRALLDAVEQMEFDRVITVFQPHTYTRTIAFFDEFVQQLNRPDIAVLADIYAAREQNTTGISSADLCAKIEGSFYIPDFDDILEFLKKIARPGDCIITVGAGELDQVSGALALAGRESGKKRPDPFEYGVEAGGLRDIGQIKILICYLLLSVGGSLPRHLLDQALQSDGLCSFWNIAAALSELQSSEMILQTEENGEVCYAVTPAGETCGRELETAVPLSVRERAVARATGLLSKAKAFRENRIAITKTETGYLVSLTIPDRDMELMTVRLGVADSLQANLIKEKFLENPQQVYQKVLEALGLC